MKRTGLITVALLCAACSRETLVAPTPIPPPVAACVTQNSAELTLTNASPTEATYDILIDGVKAGTLGPGRSATYTLVAGIPHTIVSQFTGTTTAACASTPSYVQCSAQQLTCRA